MSVKLDMDVIKKAAAEAAQRALSAASDNNEAAVKAANRAAQRATEEANINDMSRGDFAQLIFDRVSEKMGEMLNKTVMDALAPLNDRMADLNTLVAERAISAAKIDPSFDTFKDQVAEKLQQRPTLSVAEALAVVKAENPGKVKELSDAELKAANDKLAQEAPKFGGFFPTSSSLATSKSDKLSPKEAALAAWDELGLGSSKALASDPMAN